MQVSDLTVGNHAPIQRPIRVPSLVVRHGPIVTPDMLAGTDGANINGPSLIRVPDWVSSPLGRYYLYFAHHQGAYIRLAYADTLAGPWRLYKGGVLSLEECPFARGHIASPDVHINAAGKTITMYFHGPSMAEREQRTFAAVSADGLGFTAPSTVLGRSYVRVFARDGWHYGIFGAKNQRLCRSRTGLSKFEPGPLLFPLNNGTDPTVRHVALQKIGESLRVYYTRRGDAPERILFGDIDLRRDWKDWTVYGQQELMRPERVYEGADEPIAPSKGGIARGREHALRDPAIYEENGRTWLLYAIAGEQGIALAEIP